MCPRSISRPKLKSIKYMAVSIKGIQNMNQIRNKIVSVILITILSIGQLSLPAFVLASELPSSPEAPSTPSLPGSDETPDEPDVPEIPDLPQDTVEETQEETIDSEEPNLDEVVEPEIPETPSLPGEESSDGEFVEDESAGEYISDSQDSEEYTGDSTPSQTGSVSEDGSSSDPKIITGDAESQGAIINTGNNNYSSTPSGSSGSGVSILSGENGSDSTNTGAVVLDDTSSTTQTNNADVESSLILDSNSGENSASRNVGDVLIDTGDAEVTGTIVNAVNTNVDGVAVSEFNVSDDQIGDIILDFGSYCITGCSAWSVDVVNEGNGSDSTNTGTVDLTLDNDTTQVNNATLTNDLILSANSGDNTADDNTGGDIEIVTGDASVSGNIVNFVNNNLAGNVIYGVVNIFGDLVGDIILSESLLAALGYSGTDISVGNIGNGTGSTNSGTVDLTQADTFNQLNDATILNNIDLDGTTGGNSTSANTGGDSSITTGDVDIDANVLNIANTNIIGGTWWIVLINEAGNWFGKILGAPDGSNYAGSSGTQFALNPDGTINVTNEGNGADSTNIGIVTADVTNTTNQTNTANITNNIDLSANTGGNSASRNTGGNSSITTGDAKIMLNLINFVNNNFAGGNVVLTVVNVFGSWLGDFVTPGSKKENNNLAASSNPSNPSGSTQGSGNDSGGASGSQTSTASNSSNSSSTSTAASNTIVPPALIAVLGALSGNLQNSGGAQVAGFVTSAPDAGTTIDSLTGKKKIKINLAWAFLLIPFAGGLFIINRRLIHPAR